MNDADKARAILNLIQHRVDAEMRELMENEIQLATWKVKKEYKDKENDKNYGGGITVNPCDEIVRRGEVSVDSAKKSLETWRELYRFTLDQMFKNLIK